jgi:flagellar motility protein MotE (MotC chaperone)
LAWPRQNHRPPRQPPPSSRLGASIDDDIAQRDSKAAGEARTLDLREAAIKAAQARLVASVQSQQAPATGAATSPETTDQFDNLARIYQAMKPARAAPVFAQLDIEVQYLVAKRMRERSTAMILAAMEPAAAARLTMALAGKKPAGKRK